MITPHDLKECQDLCSDLAEQERRGIIQGVSVPAQFAEVSALLSDEEWAHIFLEVACRQARQYLREGAPGRALEVLDQALASYDQEQDQNLGSQPPF